MVEKKESNIYKQMKEIDLSKRQTLAGQLLKEYELSQVGSTVKTGSYNSLGQEKNEIEILEDLIKAKREKLEKLNKFSEHMHFMDDQEIVEMYEVIHKEEMQLERIVKKYELLKAERENLKEI